jgi:hypothetical protein
MLRLELPCLVMASLVLAGVTACGSDAGRDPLAFLGQVSTGMGPSWHSLAMAESKAFLAEGDRACQWIKGQPLSRQGDAREAYVADTKPIAEIPNDRRGALRQYVADVAWGTLCHPTFAKDPED